MTAWRAHNQCAPALRASHLPAFRHVMRACVGQAGQSYCLLSDASQMQPVPPHKHTNACLLGPLDGCLTGLTLSSLSLTSVSQSGQSFTVVGWVDWWRLQSDINSSVPHHVGSGRGAPRSSSMHRVCPAQEQVEHISVHSKQSVWQETYVMLQLKQCMYSLCLEPQ